MPAVLADAKGAQQLIKLPGQSIDCALAKVEQAQLGSGSMPVVQALPHALDDLQRLTKIMAGHSEEYCFELATVQLLCRDGRACHSRETAGALDGSNWPARSAHGSKLP